MTAQEANDAANNKIETTYTYANLLALISQEASAGNFLVSKDTVGYSEEYEQFFPNLIGEGYTIKTDYGGFVAILWDNENVVSTSTTTIIV